MCGICGIKYFVDRKVNTSDLLRMMNLLKHRGPDDEGIYVDNNIGFGFMRLSIIDLSTAGHQPMWDETHRYVIVYNGEVYNYIELREELIKKGYKFQSSTDTEVVLYSYIEYGESALHKFNGMFAFVIYDTIEKKLFGARDRFGVKPFYYFQNSESFVFASEIPPLLEVLNSRPQANDRIIFDYLTFNRTDHTAETFFSNIFKLQHGECFTIEGKEVRFKRWYDLHQQVQQPFESGDEFREMFISSIKLRLRSDVPVGVCLSGGIDSSSIVSVLIKSFGRNDIKTFSAIYDDECDESKYINLFSTMLKNMYYVTPDAESLYNDINNFINAQGEPVPSTSPYAHFKVMELARGRVVVTLDGQGADELFAGYPYFFGMFYKELLLKLKFLKLMSENISYFFKHRSLYAFKTFIFYIFSSTIRTKLRVTEKGYLTRDFSKKYVIDNFISENLYEAKTLNELLVNHFEFKLEHLLKWEDRNSMWFSLESRVPFLDYRLVERTLSLPSDVIIKKGMTKYFLRNALKDYLPPEIARRKDKKGFDTPEDKWFRTELFRSLVMDILSSQSFIQRGYIDAKKAIDKYCQYLNGEINISKEIWKWINLELWFRKFIDCNEV
ncbi:MAG: asparagine synthase (glutamine-hydrolyzing) [Ignavibacteria bacterium]